MNLREDSEAGKIARDLSAKYGMDALAFVAGRARRAAEIGDELAYAIWNEVWAATGELQARQPGYFREAWR